MQVVTPQKSRDHLGEMVEITPLAKKAFILHAWYFASCILSFEMTCLSGELFFVSMSAYGLIPFAQTSYNLNNSLIWTVVYPTFSPLGEQIELIKLDAVLIAGLFITYVYTFFTASVGGGYQRINYSSN